MSNERLPKDERMQTFKEAMRYTWTALINRLNTTLEKDREDFVEWLIQNFPREELPVAIKKTCATCVHWGMHWHSGNTRRCLYQCNSDECVRDEKHRYIHTGSRYCCPRYERENEEEKSCDE